MNALKGCDFFVDSSKSGSIKSTSASRECACESLAEQAADNFISTLSDSEKFELQCFDPCATLGSDGICSSSDSITKKFLLGQMEDLP